MNEFVSTIGQPNAVSIGFFFAFVAFTLVITYFRGQAQQDRLGILRRRPIRDRPPTAWPWPGTT